MASDLELVESDVSSGDNCLEKSLEYGSQGLLGGSVFGAVESCVSIVPQATITGSGPLFMYSLRTIGSRGLLGGSVLFTFAGVSCLVSRLRNKDDYFNALIGGGVAGSIFGIIARSVPLTIGLSFGSGVTMAIIKYRHGTYFPPLPLPRATIQHQERAWPSEETK